MWRNVGMRNLNLKNGTLVIFQRVGCNLRCIWLYLLLQKYPRVEFFIGFLLQMLKANDFNRDGCRIFIVQFPYRKMKTFLMNNFGIKCFQWDLKVWNIVFVSLLSLRQSLNLCIDNLFYWHIDNISCLLSTPG